MKALSIKHLNKNKILNDINLDIEAGEIVALVGPNGSGKSTLMKCIMGFSNIDSGEIWIFDSLNNKKALKGVACSIEYPPLYSDLNGLDHFKLISQLNNINEQQMNNYIEFSCLKERLKKKTKYYSVGMKQMLILSLVIMQNPRLLILDEPFNGLDLQTKKRVIDELENLNKQGTTILWSSHEINQLREMSDRYVFINCGKIVGHMQNEKKYKAVNREDPLERYYFEVWYYVKKKDS